LEADHLHGVVDLQVGTMGDFDPDVVVKPRRLDLINRCDELVSPRRVEVIDLGRGLEVPSPEWCDVNTG
jgi:hypothetical protein